jgi:2-keto-4-pentenoate hydratase
MAGGPTGRFALLLVLAHSIGAFADESVINDWAAELARAHQNREAIPVLSYHYTRVDNIDAYKIQAAYVQLRINRGLNERVSGYKAAATSKAAQKALAARAPMGGVMFESGAAQPGATLVLANYGRLMVEVELGYRLKSPVNEIIIRIQDLKNLVAEIVPVIELPDAGYSSGSRSQLTDFIAANALYSGYLPGRPFDLRSVDPNSLQVALTRDGELINEARGDSALGDQWHALHWLVNHTVAQGYTIGTDDLLITGLLGQPVVAEAGDYVATFGNNESIRFHIE